MILRDLESSRKASATILRIVLAAFTLSVLCLPAAAQKVLTLGEALEIAMERSPEMKHARFRLERSEASLRAANARLKSRFSLSITPIDYSNSKQFNDFFSTYNRQETTSSYGTFRITQPIKWTDGTLSLINRLSWRDSYSEYNDERTEVYSNNLYIQFDQPLFTYNRTKMDLRSLQLELENSQLYYALRRLSIEKQVMERFYNVYETKMQLEISEEEYENNEERHSISQNKVDAGILSLDDLYQSELDMANARSTLNNNRVNLENALDLFKQLLGIGLDEEIEISADIAYKETDVDLQKAISHGLKHRAEIRQQQIAIEQAQQALVRAGTKNEFYGNISLSYGSIGTDELFSQLYDAPDKNQQAVVSFEIPLWDWGEKKADIKAAELSLEESRLSMKEEEDNIIIDIRQAYRNVENQVMQIDIAKQNVRRSELTYEINLEKYRNGDLSSYQLNEFQSQLSRARLSEVSALILYKQYLLDMKIQALWDFENNISIVQ